MSEGEESPVFKGLFKSLFCLEVENLDLVLYNLIGRGCTGPELTERLSVPCSECHPAMGVSVCDRSSGFSQVGDVTKVPDFSKIPDAAKNLEYRVRV